MTKLPAVLLFLAPFLAHAAPDYADIAVISIETEEELDVLREDGFQVTTAWPGHAEVYLRGNDQERLEARGYPVTIVDRERPPPPGPKSAPGPETLGQYHDYEAVTGFLEYYADAYPELTELSSAGRSVEGRELWTLLITPEPETRHERPVFRYISTMHGDEPVGTEMLLYFIDLLLTGYGQDERITELVDSTTIWIMPLMNPDGLESGRRNNANNIDLNRAFPDYRDNFTETIFPDENVDTGGFQPEVRHVMEWSNAERFDLTANFHTGALVVNYPYDHEPGVPSGAEAPAPDDALFRELSMRYAEQNAPMMQNPAFPGGITNGSAWFAIQGGMQDWTYRFTGAPAVTIELSNQKRPPASTLPGYWEDNREAMLRYAESIHMSLRGQVTDMRTGEPVYARVTVEDNEQPVFTHPESGWYTRLLLPGTHDLTVNAPLYAPAWLSRAETGDEAHAELVFADVNRDGGVNAQDIQLIINEALGIPTPADIIRDPTGSGSANAQDIQHVINAVLHGT
ncbi:MAG: M14 family zinc carboxypeptidase [Candidatus Hydrogenedentota bacterium]